MTRSMAESLTFGNIDPLMQLDAATKAKIHIRYQLNGPRAITLIEGLEEDLDLKRIAKSMKKRFSCASSIHTDEGSGASYIKLQGDHRDSVREWLLQEKIVSTSEAKERIVIHGY